MAAINSSVVTLVGVMPSQSPHRSPVIIPALRVSRVAFSRAEAKSARGRFPSSSPRLARAPLQAKMVATGLVEVFSPFR